jgi:hypothetical protein
MPYGPRMRSLKTPTLLVVILCFVSLVPVHGDEFKISMGGIDAVSGTLQFPGAGPFQGALTGADLLQAGPKQFVWGVALPFVDGALYYSPGALQAFDSADWYFGPGGSMTLTGSLSTFDQNTIGNVVIPDTTLISGTFVGTPLVHEIPLFGSSSFYEFKGSGVATLNPQFAKLLGFPDVLYTFSLYSETPSAEAVPPPNAFFIGQNGRVFQFDVIATPEPSSIILLVMIAVGVGFAMNHSSHKL